MPGAGGHRFVHYLMNCDYRLDIRYDTYHQKKDSILCGDKFRYLTDSSQPVDINTNTTILTHTMNNSLIERVFPGHKIYNLDIDLKRSLKRYINKFSEVDKVIDNKELVESDNYLDICYNSIVWHNDYYKKYPVDYTNGVVISHGHEFYEFMGSYLSNITDKWFDLAWGLFEQYGSDAPVIDIYNEIKNDFNN